MTARLLFPTLLAAALTASTGVARAGEFVSRAEGSRIGVTTEISPPETGAVSMAGLGWEITGQFAVTKNFAVDLSIPWAWGKASISIPPYGTFSADAAYIGNFTAGGHYVSKVAPGAAVYGGLTVTIPSHAQYTVNTLDAGIGMRAAVGHAAGFDMYRYYPGMLSFRVPLGTELRLAPMLYYRGTLTPTVGKVVASTDLPAVDNYFVWLEHSDEIEARSHGFGLGFRFQVAFGLNGSDRHGGLDLAGTLAETGIEPFLTYEPESAGLFARLGYLFSLNVPPTRGLTSDNNVRVLRATVGAKF